MSMSAPTTARPRWWLRPIVVFAAIAIVASAAFAVWLSIPETPPACATDIPSDKATALFGDAMVRKGYSAADIATFHLQKLTRADQENWPTYFAQFSGLLQGKPRVFMADGNGCGFVELTDLGPSPSIGPIT